MSESTLKCRICNEQSSSLFTLGCCTATYHKACIAQNMLNDLDCQCPQCQTKIDRSKMQPVGEAGASTASFTLRSAGQMSRSAGTGK